MAATRTLLNIVANTRSTPFFRNDPYTQLAEQMNELETLITTTSVAEYRADEFARIFELICQLLPLEQVLGLNENHDWPYAKMEKILALFTLITKTLESVKDHPAADFDIIDLAALKSVLAHSYLIKSKCLPFNENEEFASSSVELLDECLDDLVESRSDKTENVSAEDVRLLTSKSLSLYGESLSHLARRYYAHLNRIRGERAELSSPALELINEGSDQLLFGLNNIKELNSLFGYSSHHIAQYEQSLNYYLALLQSIGCFFESVNDRTQFNWQIPAMNARAFAALSYWAEALRLGYPWINEDDLDFIAFPFEVLAESYPDSDVFEMGTYLKNLGRQPQKFDQLQNVIHRCLNETVNTISLKEMQALMQLVQILQGLTHIKTNREGLGKTKKVELISSAFEQCTSIPNRNYLYNSLKKLEEKYNQLFAKIAITIIPNDPLVQLDLLEKRAIALQEKLPQIHREEEKTNAKTTAMLVEEEQSLAIARTLFQKGKEQSNFIKYPSHLVIPAAQQAADSYREAIEHLKRLPEYTEKKAFLSHENKVQRLAADLYIELRENRIKLCQYLNSLSADDPNYNRPLIYQTAKEALLVTYAGLSVSASIHGINGRDDVTTVATFLLSFEPHHPLYKFLMEPPISKYETNSPEKNLICLRHLIASYLSNQARERYSREEVELSIAASGLIIYCHHYSYYKYVNDDIKPLLDELMRSLESFPISAPQRFSESLQRNFIELVKYQTQHEQGLTVKKMDLISPQTRAFLPLHERETISALYHFLRDAYLTKTLTHESLYEFRKNYYVVGQSRCDLILGLLKDVLSRGSNFTTKTTLSSKILTSCIRFQLLERLNALQSMVQQFCDITDSNNASEESYHLLIQVLQVLQWLAEDERSNALFRSYFTADNRNHLQHSIDQLTAISQLAIITNPYQYHAATLEKLRRVTQLIQQNDEILMKLEGASPVPRLHDASHALLFTHGHLSGMKRTGEVIVEPSTKREPSQYGISPS